MRKLLRSVRSESGFTLVELLGVSVILTILAAVAIPTIIGSINKAKINTAIDTASQMSSALQRYYAAQMDAWENGSFPPASTGISTDEAFENLLGEEYWTKPPNPNYTFHKYVTNSDASKFVLCVKAKDSKDTLILVDSEGQILNGKDDNITTASCTVQ